MLCGLLPAVAPAQPAIDFRAVDAAMQSAVSALTPGISLTLVLDGRVVYRKSFGSFEPDRPVPVASATKWYAAAVMLVLVDEGLLRLDDPVARLAPVFQSSKAGITLRQLLSHTSGLVADVPCLYESGATMAGCVAEIAAEPLLFAPGTRFSYGNASMQVAGRLAELVTGKPWRQVFQEKLAPLGLSCTSLDAFGSPANPVVANGATSCEGDYVKFLQMLLAGGIYGGRRMLSAWAVEEMMRDQTHGVPILESIYSDYGNLDPGLPLLRYGLGAWRERVNAGSGAAAEVGSQGATGFSPWLDRERNLAGVLATQSSQDAIMPTYLAVKAAVRAAVAPWLTRTLLVTNAASYQFGPVAPGEVVTIFGQGIGPATAATASQGNGVRFGSELGRTRVLFDGQAAPLLYADWGQITAVAPFSLEGKASTVVQVERDAAAGPQFAVAVARVAPAIFQLEGARAAALNEDGRLNTPANPAERGTILSFWATGGGQTNPPASDGEVQAASSLLLPAAVTVGGVAAEVLYAGGAPGLIAGALQINARLSAGTPSGDAVPMVLRVGGAPSPVVTVAVR
jgi:uncharacterized protein (TIGR03437 family)